VGGCVGVWVGGPVGKYNHFVAPSCKLRLARFSARLKFQDRAECGNKPVVFSYLYNVSIHINLLQLGYGRLQKKEEGNSLVFYQTGGGTPPPNFGQP
jgi:hypothetical protein